MFLFLFENIFKGLYSAVFYQLPQENVEKKSNQFTQFADKISAQVAGERVVEDTAAPEETEEASEETEAAPEEE